MVFDFQFEIKTVHLQNASLKTFEANPFEARTVLCRTPVLKMCNCFYVQVLLHPGMWLINFSLPFSMIYRSPKNNGLFPNLKTQIQLIISRPRYKGSFTGVFSVVFLLDFVAMSMRIGLFSIMFLIILPVGRDRRDPEQGDSV